MLGENRHVMMLFVCSNNDNILTGLPGWIAQQGVYSNYLCYGKLHLILVRCSVLESVKSKLICYAISINNSLFKLLHYCLK